MAKPQTDAERAKKSRNKKKNLGEREIRLKVSAAEYAMIEKMGKLRAGCREPYTPAEYLVTLFRKVLPLDDEKYHTQAKALGMCDYCHEVMPSGCGGAFKGQKECYHTKQYRELEL